MNLKQLLVKQVFWRGMSIAGAFVMNLLFARFLGAAVTGWILYLFAVYSLVIQLVGFSLESGVGYYAAKGDINNGRLLGFSVLWTGIATSVVFLTLLLVNKFIGTVDYPLSYPVAFVCGNLLLAFGNQYCYSRYRFALPNFIALFVSVAVIAMLLIHFLVAPLPVDIPGIYFYSYLLQGLLLLFAILTTGAHSAVSFRLTKKEFKNIARYSASAFISNILFLLITRIDYFFIKQFSSLSDLGNYTQVSRIGHLFFLLPAIISSVLFPFIASGTGHSVVSSIKKILFLLFTINVTACLVLIAIGNWLFPALYGDSYDKMYQAFLFLVPGIIAICCLHPFSAFYAGKNRINVNIAGGVLALLIIVPGDILLIPVLGINGASLVSSAGYLAYLLYVVYIFGKDHQLTYRNMLVLNRHEWTEIKAAVSNAIKTPHKLL